MSTATLYLGDVFDVLADMPDQSVQSVITSPPYWRKRAYLDADHPEKSKEIGQEPSPGEFLATMLRLTDELWRIVSDDGTIWFNLGDTAAGSGGWGSDVDWINRGGGNRWVGTNGAQTADADMPKPKSVCWVPELFGASLAYGRNLLTNEPCQQWITRPKVTWCKPSVTPGEVIDRFRVGTELFVWASKQQFYYFDLDAIREPAKDGRSGPMSTGAYVGHPDEQRATSKPDRVANEKGVPPMDWWVVNTATYSGAHSAVFPPELIVRPVIASCPPGGVILDPFGGSGTTAAVATGHGRDCVLIDIDERNEHLIRERVGMFLTDVIDTRTTEVVA